MDEFMERAEEVGRRRVRRLPVAVLGPQVSQQRGLVHRDLVGMVRVARVHREREIRSRRAKDSQLQHHAVNHLQDGVAGEAEVRADLVDRGPLADA
jgi:hypothetical protein